MAKAVKLLVEAVRSKQAGGGGLGELIAALEEPREELEVRAGISADDFVAVGSEVIAAVEEAGYQDTANPAQHAAVCLVVLRSGQERHVDTALHAVRRDARAVRTPGADELLDLPAKPARRVC